MGWERERLEWSGCFYVNDVCVCVWICACSCMLYFVVSKEIHIDSLSLSLSLSPPPSLPPSLPPSVCDKQNFYKKANHSSWIIYKGEKRQKKKEKNNAINSSLFNQSSKSNVDVSSFMPMLSPSKKIHKKECSSA